MTTDCIIIGAGPVGLTTACELANFGLNVRILDQIPGPIKRTKAAVVWAKTTEFFHQLGLAEEFLGAGFPCYGANIHVNGKLAGRLNLEVPESRFDSALMIPQHKTEEILIRKLAGLGCEVEYNQKLTALKQDQHSVKITLESGEELEAPWLVGCDGAHSSVRQAVELPFVGEALESQWLVADLSFHGLDVEDEMLLFISSTGPLALFPLGDSRFRMAAEAETPKNHRDEDEAKEAVHNLVSQKMPGNAKIANLENAGYFRINERQVEQYRAGRVFLAGDAAHVHSPLGGQGMNTGIHDAHNLTWKLALAFKGVASVKLLETFHEERYPIGRALVDFTSRGTQIATLRSPIAAAIRNTVLKAVANFAPAKEQIRRNVSEIDIHYCSSSLSKEPEHHGPGWHFGKGVKAGCRAPDADVLFPNNQPGRLHDCFTDCRFHLLLFGSIDPKSWSQFENILSVAKEIDGDWIQVIGIGTEQNAPSELKVDQYLFDSDGTLHHDYAATQPCFYLVRPDGYVGQRSQPPDQKELEEYLSFLSR